MNNERRKTIYLAQASIQEAVTLRDELLGKLTYAKSLIGTAKDEEEEYKDNMPDSLQYSEKGERAEEAIQALEGAIEKIDAIEEALGEMDGDIEALLETAVE